VNLEYLTIYIYICGDSWDLYHYQLAAALEAVKATDTHPDDPGSIMFCLKFSIGFETVQHSNSIFII